MKTHIDQLSFTIGSFNEVIKAIARQLNSPGKIILPCSLNDLALQKSNLSHQKNYREIDICTTDSMLLTFWLKLTQKNQIERVYGPDLMLALLENCKNKTTVFLGAEAASVKKLKKKINQANSKKNHFLVLPKSSSAKEEAETINSLVRLEPDFVWIGIGSPKQVELAVEIRSSLPKTHIFCVGAAFDFVSNHKKQAPGWMQNYGLEWFFRLATEPKRLWKRYLITIPHYLFLIIGEKIGKLNKS